MLLAIGNEVMLNSGGPWMTVVGYTDESPNQVIVQWLDGDEIRTAQFPETSVTAARNMPTT